MKNFYNLLLLTLCLSVFTVSTTHAQCSGFPAASTTIAESTSICLTGNVVMSLGTTYSASFTYQWQSSPNGGQFFPIAGQTTPNLNVPHFGTRWYRCTITCISSGMPTNSSIVMVTSSGEACQGALCESAPETATVLVDDTTVCGGSEVVFTLNRDFTNGELFQWQYAGFNGFFITIPGATSAEYRTAVTNTYNYRCVITCAGGNLFTNTDAIEVHVNNLPPALAETPPILCSEATVADLDRAVVIEGTNLLWYTTAAGGTALNSTDVLNPGTAYYASQAIDGCESVTRTQVIVFFTDFTPQPVPDVATCATYTLPVLNQGAYYTAPGGPDGTGTLIPAGTEIAASQRIYIFAQATGQGNCTGEVSFVVTILPTPAPTGAEEQTISIAGDGVAYVTDIDVVGTDVYWYLTAEDAIAATADPVRLDTPLVSGTTYYGTQLINGCRSNAPLAVTVTLTTLGTKDIEAAKFSYYPNPVSDVLTVSHPSGIAAVTICNVVGQELVSKKADASTVTVDMSALTAGTYIVTITNANNTIKTLRVVKR